MTHEEHHDLVLILESPKWNQPRLLAEYMKTVEVGEKTSEKPVSVRTGAQNNSYWLWLKQITDQCDNLGVTADMLFKHTMHLSVTPNMLHDAIKKLIKAKWGINSTRNLNKSGHFDAIQDSVASWVGKEGVEIPPWPCDERKHLGGVKIEQTKERENYPEYTGEVKF